MTPAKKIARYNMAVNKKKPNKKLIFKQIQQVSQSLKHCNWFDSGGYKYYNQNEIVI